MPSFMSSDTRLYASAIALVSGVYSILSAWDDSMGAMSGSATVMVVVGLAALIHGAALLTPAAARMTAWSGPAMLVWAVLMLANQLAAATVPGWAMHGGMMGGTAEWDGGMVAIAVLMLVSGLIMTRRNRME